MYQNLTFYIFSNEPSKRSISVLNRKHDSNTMNSSLLRARVLKKNSITPSKGRMRENVEDVDYINRSRSDINNIQIQIESPAPSKDEGYHLGNKLAYKKIHETIEKSINDSRIKLSKPIPYQA